MSNGLARSGELSGTPSDYEDSEQQTLRQTEQDHMHFPQTRQSSPFVELFDLARDIIQQNRENPERVYLDHSQLKSPSTIEQLESIQKGEDSDFGEHQQNVDTPAPTQTSTPSSHGRLQLVEDADADWAEFLDDKKYVWNCDLGQGSDGEVAWYSNPEGVAVAVKQPILSEFTLKSHAFSRNAITAEIQNLRIIGKHENIITMLDVLQDENCETAPVLIMELCTLGDLWYYRNKLELRKGKYNPQNVPEITLTKLFVDMVSGLNFLHSHLHGPFVHGDFKLDNILVTDPEYDFDERGTVPLLPTFKIADFARLQTFPPDEDSREGWQGTAEYAPPPKEQKGSIAPATDIWGLGCVLQTFALGQTPQESEQVAIKRLPSAPPQGSEYWDEQFWRIKRLTKYRPLNVPPAILIKDFDLPHCLSWYEPYSAKLNMWYSLCFEENPESRFQSDLFAEFVIPRLQSHLEVLKEEIAAEEAFKRAVKLRNGENPSDDEAEEAQIDADVSEGTEPNEGDPAFSL